VWHHLDFEVSFLGSASKANKPTKQDTQGMGKLGDAQTYQKDTERSSLEWGSGT